MSQSYTNYFTYATSRPSPPQIAFWSGKYETAPCRDARECRVGGHPLCQRLQHRDFNGDGRTDRGALHGDVSFLTTTDAVGRDTLRPGIVNNNLRLGTCRNEAMSGKTDFHVDISKYPRGEFLFPR